MAEPTIRAYPKSLARNMDLTGRQDISSSVKNIALNMYETGWLPPTGSVFPFAGTGIPFGYLLCDGAAVSRDVYSGLFYVIGELYGPGDGSTTFNVPNMKGLFPVMRDPLNPDFTSLGQTGGSGVHTLTIPEMPIHNHTGLTQPAGAHLHSITDVQHFHTINDPGHQHDMKTESVGTFGPSAVVANNDQGFGGIPGSPAFTNITGANAAFSGITSTNATGTHVHVIDNQGGSLPHNNLPPYFTLNFIIKL